MDYYNGMILSAVIGGLSCGIVYYMTHEILLGMIAALVIGFVIGYYHKRI